LQNSLKHIDRQLLLACYKGDEKAQFALYKKCYSLLFGICRRYANDHDETGFLLNAGFLKIVKGLNRYRDEVPFEAWIRKIMINTIIDNHRKNKKYKETVAYPEVGLERFVQHPIELNDAEKQFNVEELRYFISKLPPTTSKVFNLFAIDGYAHKEISIMLGMSTGTSKWHLSHARQRLKKMIREAMEKKIGKAERILKKDKWI
jgi:RNA polymerase sigma-70 factor (ECF subfamily)